MSSTLEAVSLEVFGMSVLLSLWLWLKLWVPADALLELRGEAEQQVFATGRRDQLDSDRDPVRGLVQGQRDRRLAGHVPDPDQRAETNGVVGDPAARSDPADRCRQPRQCRCDEHAVGRPRAP